MGRANTEAGRAFPSLEWGSISGPHAQLHTKATWRLANNTLLGPEPQIFSFSGPGITLGNLYSNRLSQFFLMHHPTFALWPGSGTTGEDISSRMTREISGIRWRREQRVDALITYKFQNQRPWDWGMLGFSSEQAVWGTLFNRDHRLWSQTNLSLYWGSSTY